MTKNEALKLALEALQWNWEGEPLPTLELQAINAIKEALAQQEQKPMAWDGKCVLGHCGSPAGCEDSDCCRADFTTPPQRTWVGLTDEEKHQLNNALNLQDRFPIIDAIEAKLREKNGG